MFSLLLNELVVNQVLEHRRLYCNCLISGISLQIQARDPGSNPGGRTISFTDLLVNHIAGDLLLLYSCMNITTETPATMHNI